MLLGRILRRCFARVVLPEHVAPLGDETVSMYGTLDEESRYPTPTSTTRLCNSLILSTKPWPLLCAYDAGDNIRSQLVLSSLASSCDKLNIRSEEYDGVAE